MNGLFLQQKKMAEGGEPGNDAGNSITHYSTWLQTLALGVRGGGLARPLLVQRSGDFLLLVTPLGGDSLDLRTAVAINILGDSGQKTLVAITREGERKRVIGPNTGVLYIHFTALWLSCLQSLGMKEAALYSFRHLATFSCAIISC